jgi:CheY-like chemotaxis protein
MERKVLLVHDDNESFLRSAANAFSAETCEVVLAENVQEAIAKSEAAEMDLLVMKLDSRTDAGWAAIDEITEGNPFLPVIVITSRLGLRELAEDAGARALVEEPVNESMLAQTIRELLTERVEGRIRPHSLPHGGFRHVVPVSGSFCDLSDGRYRTPYGSKAPALRWGINE